MFALCYVSAVIDWSGLWMEVAVLCVGWTVRQGKRALYAVTDWWLEMLANISCYIVCCSHCSVAF